MDVPPKLKHVAEEADAFGKRSRAADDDKHME